ncbi:AcrR family transcriptional regulator [Granulicella aggregans]|uniref:AcrR family transcriptional regulator n=1 Tax=Granulicella aggregans TaxID=474949 RepID=A0A7W7ZC48_9BACT|nr:TetR/AcrR family transcriptional regulator [Granulicella aggregans]MBB5057042.1 AcrR family transcriptional regulator [Granulicella aggregans]
MIIAKAAPVFNQRGFAGCSMQDLMQATGLEKGGIYRHFASKEELAVAAFRYAMQEAVAARIVDLDKVSGAIPRLMHVVKAFVEIPSPVPGGCPLLNVAAYSESGCEGVQAQAKDFMGAWKARLLGILEDGVASGELRGDVDAKRTANAVISMLEGSLVISRIEGTKQARRDAQETLEVMLSGLASASAAQA